MKHVLRFAAAVTVPAALSLAGLALIGFLWSVKSGQYDDLSGAPLRALSDDDIEGTNSKP